MLNANFHGVSAQIIFRVMSIPGTQKPARQNILNNDRIVSNVISQQIKESDES